MRPFIIRKLSRMILATLFVVVAIIMTMVTYFTAATQKRYMIQGMTLLGEELAHLAVGSIRYPMAIGDSAAIQKQLLDMRSYTEGLLKGVEVLICDSKQNITYASHESSIGTRMADAINDDKVWTGLTHDLDAGKGTSITLEKTRADNRFLLHVDLIINQPECHHCHGSITKILGGIAIKIPTDQTYASIANLRNQNILLGILGICTIIGLTYQVLTRWVTRPVAVLAKQMRELPERMAAGDYTVHLAGDRQDEIGDLFNSFDRMAMDLTEKNLTIQKANEELGSANKELEAFAYTVSHDLRAPLRNIDGFSKILLDDYTGQLDDKGKHYLNRVRNGTVKMSLLIDDMLTFSRAGRMEIHQRPVGANVVINNALRDFSEAIRTRDVEIKVHDLPVMVCDQVMIQHAFSNLIGNAIKYSRDTKHPRLTIGFDQGKGAIFFEDNGIGFDMKYHDKIFQVFQRLHLPEEYEGTGVGLAVVKRIIERHEGSVWAESTPGNGATFFVKLHLADGNVNNT